MMTIKREDTGVRFSFCASCRTRRRFQYVGEQRWPERVAKVTGLPAVVQLWQCCTCRTSVTRSMVE